MKVKDFVNSDNWTQGALCRNEKGEVSAWPHANDEAKFCIAGMIIRCYKYDHVLVNIFKRVRTHLKDNNMEAEGNIGKWNDSAERTWEHIRDLATELDI